MYCPILGDIFHADKPFLAEYLVEWYQANVSGLVLCNTKKEEKRRRCVPSLAWQSRKEHVRHEIFEVLLAVGWTGRYQDGKGEGEFVPATPYLHANTKGICHPFTPSSKHPSTDDMGNSGTTCTWGCLVDVFACDCPRFPSLFSSLSACSSRWHAEW